MVRRCRVCRGSSVWIGQEHLKTCLHAAKRYRQYHRCRLVCFVNFRNLASLEIRNVEPFSEEVSI